MANQFTKTVNTAVGTTPVTVYQTGATTRATIIGINIANITGGPISVDIQFFDSGPSITAYVVKGVLIAKGTALAAIGGDQKLVLEPNDAIIITSNTAASADVIVSALELIS